MGFDDFFSPTIHVLYQATCPQDNSACILMKIIFFIISSFSFIIFFTIVGTQKVLAQ